MTTCALLLRAVNLGGRNRLAMADLRSILTDLGHDHVRTVLNSGNAVFTTSRSDLSGLAAEVEGRLHADLGLAVRATVRTEGALAAALSALPADVASSSYVLLAFLFDRPTAAAVKVVQDWDVAPERLVLGDGVVYLGYAGPMHRSRLTNAALERRLGVVATARTPGTVRTLLA